MRDFIFKDRQILYVVLVFVVFCVFSLGIVYGMVSLDVGTDSKGLSSGIKEMSNKPLRIVNGDVYTLGSEVCIGDQCFYIINNNKEDIVLLSKYNIDVGKVYTSFDTGTKIKGNTGIQNSRIRGFTYSQDYNPVDAPWFGIISFSNTKYWGTVSDKTYQYIFNDKSNYYPYVQIYKDHIEELGVEVNEARLLSAEEYNSIIKEIASGEECLFGGPDWLCHTTFALGSATKNGDLMWIRAGLGLLIDEDYSLEIGGIRPVIVISSAYF